MYAESTRVTLRAAAAPGYTFAGWSGALEGTLNPAEITVTRAQEVKAFFSRSSGVRWLLPPAHDSYVRGSLYSSRNFDSDTFLRVREGGADLYRCRSFLKFDLSSVSGTVVQATLLLHSRVGNSFPDGTPVNVHACRTGGDSNSWTETGLTWKNAAGDRSGLSGRAVIRTVLGPREAIEISTGLPEASSV